MHTEHLLPTLKMFSLNFGTLSCCSLQSEGFIHVSFNAMDAICVDH
jgi:hypothetical protein